MEYKITLGYPYVGPPPDVEENLAIPGEAQDVDLTAEEYRIYCHLTTRAVKHGTWLGVKAVCRRCYMMKHIVIQSLRALEKRCMLRVIEQPGKPSEYVLTAPSEWKVSSRVLPPSFSPHEPLSFLRAPSASA